MPLGHRLIDRWSAVRESPSVDPERRSVSYRLDLQHERCKVFVKSIDTTPNPQRKHAPVAPRSRAITCLPISPCASSGSRDLCAHTRTDPNPSVFNTRPCEHHTIWPYPRLTGTNPTCSHVASSSMRSDCTFGCSVHVVVKKEGVCRSDRLLWFTL